MEQFPHFKKLSLYDKYDVFTWYDTDYDDGGLNHIQAGHETKKENGILATGWGQNADFESKSSFKSQVSTQ